MGLICMYCTVEIRDWKSEMNTYKTYTVYYTGETRSVAMKSGWKDVGETTYQNIFKQLQYSTNLLRLFAAI
jgi:hypothetical protein